MSEFLTAAFYKFVELPDYIDLRERLIDECERQQTRGTILIAHEGINGTIAGCAESVAAVLAFLRTDPRLTDLGHKESFSRDMPFYRMKVRLKREIVTMGQPNINPARQSGRYVKPQDWNALISDPEVVVIDTRNDYEVELGSFKGAINPGTQSFRELPQQLLSEPKLTGKPKVAMFCTGGIRCEKSTAFLRQHGFDEVYHLEGGILKYLETVPKEQSLWSGECFVFDERVTVDHDLKPGNYELCRACRHPLDETDKTSEHYVPGVSCPKCHARHSDDRKARFAERERQVALAKARNDTHIGVPMPSADIKTDE